MYGIHQRLCLSPGPEPLKYSQSGCYKKVPGAYRINSKRHEYPYAKELSRNNEPARSKYLLVTRAVEAKGERTDPSQKATAFTGRV